MNDFEPADYAAFDGQLRDSAFSARVRDLRALGVDLIDAMRLALAEEERRAYAEDESRDALIEALLSLAESRAGSAPMEAWLA